MNELNQPARGYDEIIRRLNVAREAQDLTYRALAERAGIGKNTAMNMLRDGSGTTYTLIQLVKALGLEIQVI